MSKRSQLDGLERTLTAIIDGSLQVYGMSFAQRDDIIAARERLRFANADLARVTAERDDLKKRINVLVAQRDCLSASLASADKQRDKLREQRNAVVAGWVNDQSWSHEFSMEEPEVIAAVGHSLRQPQDHGENARIAALVFGEPFGDSEQLGTDAGPEPSGNP